MLTVEGRRRRGVRTPSIFLVLLWACCAAAAAAAARLALPAVGCVLLAAAGIAVDCWRPVDRASVMRVHPSCLRDCLTKDGIESRRLQARASSTCTDVHLGMSSDMQIDDPSPRCGGQSRRGKLTGCVLQLLLVDCTELMVPACYCDPSRWLATIVAAADG